MQYKNVGRTGLKVSAIGLGCMMFGQQVNEVDAIKIMDVAFEKGITLFDTAEGYNAGRSEEIVGKALKNKRHAVVLATKVFSSERKAGPNDSGLSRAHIMQAVEDSLKRLDTDYLDLYYAHQPDHTTPIEETLRAFDNLVQQGKVRYIACSNYYVWQLVKAQAISERYNLARFDCIQSPYNLLTRDIEVELLPCCANEGIGVTVYHPLAAGLLTGKHDLSKSPAPNTRFGMNKGYYERYWSAINFKAVDQLKRITDAYGHNLAQFSIAWILNNPVISSAIVGATSTKQVEENIGATELKLTADETKVCEDIWLELRPPRYFYGR